MRRGFTLVELMTVLLLTGILLSSLFFFTFYFWKNHMDHMSHLQFTDQKQVFMDWIHEQVRNSVTLTIEGGKMTCQLKDGSKVELQGAEFNGLPFFTEETTCQFRQDKEKTHLIVILQQGRWKERAEVWVQEDPMSVWVEGEVP